MARVMGSIRQVNGQSYRPHQDGQWPHHAGQGPGKSPYQACHRPQTCTLRVAPSSSPSSAQHSPATTLWPPNVMMRLVLSGICSSCSTAPWMSSCEQQISLQQCTSTTHRNTPQHYHAQLLTSHHICPTKALCKQPSKLSSHGTTHHRYYRSAQC